MDLFHGADVIARKRVRFTLKSLGHSVRNPSSESFHKTVLSDVPADCLPVVQPLLTVLAHVTEQIKRMESNHHDSSGVALNR
jgi:hypothetical protein